MPSSPATGDIEGLAAAERLGDTGNPLAKVFEIEIPNHLRVRGAVK